MNLRKHTLSLAVLVTGSAAIPVLAADGTIVKDSTSKPGAAASNEQRLSTSETQSTQAQLGIGVEPLPPVLTSHLPEVIDKGRGILISDVTPGSPADQAGLRKHDVLVRYDDQDLYSPEQLVKRVRNDQPGKDVELEYVRAGKLSTVKVTLSEMPAQAPVESDWPGISRRFEMPFAPLRPDFLSETEDAFKQGTEWTHFESMSVTKDSDGKYQAKVSYKDSKGDSISREYIGTRQEVRDAIESDAELPEDQKRQLLRSLDDRGDIELPTFDFRSFPNWRPWRRELFNWPDVSF